MSRQTAPVAALLAALLTACAGAPPQRDWCVEAFTRSDAFLRAGLAEYVAKMRRYTRARDPAVDTAKAEERVLRSADAWTAAHRASTIAECRTWPEERLVCVLEATHASEIGPCGLEALVQSFTDEVVATYAARPFDGR